MIAIPLLVILTNGFLAAVSTFFGLLASMAIILLSIDYFFPQEKIEGLEDIDNELAEFIITNNNYNDIKLFIYEQQLSIQTHDMITGCEYEVVGEFDCYEYHVYEEAYDIKADVLINFTSEERITNRRMVKELGSDNYKEKIESETMVHAIGIKII